MEENKAAQNQTSKVKPQRYSAFLLVMLIFSSIMTTFLVLASIGTISELAKGSDQDSLRAIINISVERNVFYWVSSIASIIIALGSALALALLWMKNKLGIILKFILLALTFVNMFFALGIEQKVNFRSYIRGESAEYFNGVFLYGSGGLAAIFISVGAIFLGGIATLWFFAWKAQQKNDGKKGFLGD